MFPFLPPLLEAFSLPYDVLSPGMAPLAWLPAGLGLFKDNSSKSKIFILLLVELFGNDAKPFVYGFAF